MRTERLSRLREQLRAAALDSLLVTHPPNIRYLTGLAASAGAVIVGEGVCQLLVDFRYTTSAHECVRDLAGATVVVTSSPFEEEAAAALKDLDAHRIGIEGDHLSVTRFQKIAAAVAPRTLEPTQRVVERLRAIKDDAEIAILREAGRRISAVARDARRWVVAGATEIAVAAAVDAAMRDAGFERPAFETIVASGPNGALPHARPTGRILAEGDGVVLDFGGVYDGYCVDLSRTLHLGPMPTAFRRMFDAVRDAQAAALSAVAPGAFPADIDGAARQVLVQRGLGDAFGHGTGHGLGLEVHEEPRISRLAPPGEPVIGGMVFTIEPGAYVPGVGGVRIEDDVLVVEGGCEQLTDVPVDL